MRWSTFQVAAIFGCSACRWLCAGAPHLRDDQRAGSANRSRMPDSAWSRFLFSPQLAPQRAGLVQARAADHRVVAPRKRLRRLFSSTAATPGSGCLWSRPLPRARASTDVYDLSHATHHAGPSLNTPPSRDPLLSHSSVAHDTSHGLAIALHHARLDVRHRRKVRRTRWRAENLVAFVVCTSSLAPRTSSWGRRRSRPQYLQRRKAPHADGSGICARNHRLD